MSSEAPEPVRPTTAPIRRLRVVPNPSAAPAPVRSGGRHRKPDPDDQPGDDFPDAATDAATDAVPLQRIASLTVPLPGA